jgi:uncharacterized 2Fe-2S/4Fe-4S cluster protein (DUF4445 family)
MNDFVHIELQPRGEIITIKSGTLLQDVLFGKGVEFPCGGRGRCKGCRVRVLGGSLSVTTEDQQKFTPSELEAGWRLACRARPTGAVKLELAQWEATVLTDDSVFPFTPSAGWGIALDLGTTTIVAQLLDLQTGRVLAVRTALNEQAKHGADIMSRVEFAVAEDGVEKLEHLVRRQLGTLCLDLLAKASSPKHTLRAEQAGTRSPSPLGASPLVKNVVIVGNTVMHHLFCSLDLEPLSHVPFETPSPGLQVFPSSCLDWKLPGDPLVRFLPCLGGFVGSDILAGILATRLHESESLVALLDLGTNGEIVLGNRERLLCASTAAGPAFEGARISMGMRAATGAISEVRAMNGSLQCHVLGDSEPRGVCGSGLVDAVATALDLGWIVPNGRLLDREELILAAPVSLNARDIRELQLAKGAIAAGLQILLEQWGATENDLTQVYLAGAFGNYINQASARRIGLLGVPPEKIRPAGNTALLGAKMALFSLSQHDGAYPGILNKTRHLSLNEDPHFQEVFVAAMRFPDC